MLQTKWDDMTVQQKNYVKHNVFNVSTLIAVIGFIIYQAGWQSTVDAHMLNESVHMKFEKKIQIFVPRVELTSEFKNLKDQLTRIEGKLDIK